MNTALFLFLSVFVPFLFMAYVWKSGDWRFCTSDLALVECEEHEIDYSEAPERNLFIFGALIAAVLMTTWAMSQLSA